MRKYTTDQLRNVALVAHGGAGKTSLAEAMLFCAGVTDRLGKVEAGTTLSDSDPDEIERQISIVSALLPCDWRGHKLNLLDTPGYADFMGEVIAGLHVADSVVLVVDGVSGIEVGTERSWQMARDRGLATLIVVNKLDKEHSDFDTALSQARERLGCNPVALQLPIGRQTEFRGVVDLLRQKAVTFHDGKPQEGPVPGDMADAVAAARERIVEAAAESEDALTEKYLEEGTLSDEEVLRGLRVGTLAGVVTPVMCAAAVPNLGATTLLDAIVAWLPSPADRPAIKAHHPQSGAEESRTASTDVPTAAQVFKTTADPYAGKLSFFRTFSGLVHSDTPIFNATQQRSERIGPIMMLRGKTHEAVAGVAAGDIGVVAKLKETTTGDTLCDDRQPVLLLPIAFPDPVIAFSIKAKNKADEDKVGSGLNRLVEEDPTLRVSLDPQTHETILSGMGDLHLEVTVGRLRRKFGVEVETGLPTVAYRETVRGRSRVQGRHKKQTGGRGQFGDVWVRVEPAERGAGFEFVDEVTGGVVPRNFIPAVEKGVREAMERGVLAGYPVVDIRVTLDDGSSHSVDSSELAFKIAGSMALQKGVEEANPVLLEPIMAVEVVTPSEFMGDVMGGLNAKRGRIQGVEQSGANQVIKALAPQAEMFTYANELRSMTQGRAAYTMSFSHYEELPDHLAQRVIAEAAERREKEREKS